MRWVSSVLFVVALAFAFALGCSSKKNGFDNGDGGMGDDSSFDDGSCAVLNCDNPDGGNGAQLDINPKNVTLQIVNGNIPTQAFTVTMGTMDVTSQVVWSFDQPIIGDIPSGNTFIPSGKSAGVGTLTALLANPKGVGTTTITVTIDKTVNTGNLTMQQQMQLGNPNGGADPAQVVYPYDNTFFPLKVLAPEIRWNGSNAGEVYRLRFTSKFLPYTEYFNNTPPPSRHIVPQADWSMIEYSGNGPQSDPLKVELTRMAGNTVYNPKTETWHIAKGNLHGSIFYWELPDNVQNCGNQYAGRILRIKPDSTMVDPFFTNNGACWGCHTVSRDGKTVMASFNFPVGTVDVSKNPAVQNMTMYGTGTFSAFNDKGDKAMIATDQFGQYKLNIFDVKTGNMLKADVFSQFGKGSEPAWSPNGLKLAAIANGSGSFGWFFDTPQGDLIIADYNNGNPNNFKVLITGASGTGRPAYPSFYPTSDYIAYGRPTAGSRSTGTGDLWITDLTGKTKKLAVASSDNKSFNPVFAPLRAGGYSWIVYITRRDYGNRLVGTNRQQLWITAIDDPPTSSDPSHPPFYVRGQEDCAKSENAYYALDPCKMKGQSCESGVDCCSGQCVKINGMYVCGDPPNGGCSADGNACMTDQDCCNAPTSKCVDGYCQPPIPQ